jgi:16S rRNA processing protein RimM
MAVTIGKILKPVGLRGELRVLPLTDFPERFKAQDAVTVITKEGHTLSCRIQNARRAHPFVYLTFHEYDSCDAVEFFRDGAIQIPETERMPLPDGSFYRDQIEGLTVYQEDGRILGQVSSIFETGSNDVYVVREREQGKEYLIPALASIVKEINVAAGRMTIRPLSEWMADGAV